MSIGVGLFLNNPAPIPSSSKTRIKTPVSSGPLNWSMSLRYHLPVKQGLRQKMREQRWFFAKLRYHLPVKQGLRLILSDGLIPTDRYLLRYHLPVKQGLRLVDWQEATGEDDKAPIPSSSKTRIKTFSCLMASTFAFKLRYHLPVKQGLRRVQGFLTSKGRFAPIPSSSKTRIKTRLE